MLLEFTTEFKKIKNFYKYKNKNLKNKFNHKFQINLFINKLKNHNNNNRLNNFNHF